MKNASIVKKNRIPRERILSKNILKNLILGHFASKNHEGSTPGKRQEDSER